MHRFKLLSSAAVRSKYSRFNSLSLRSIRYISTMPERSSVYFTVPDKVGALENILSTLRKLQISLTRIESRPSRTKGDYDFFVDFVAEPTKIQAAVKEIQKVSKGVNIVSSGNSDAGVGEVPWFPRKLSDLDTFSEKVLSYGAV